MLLVPKMVSAIGRCPLFLSAIERFFYETLAMISLFLRKSVRYREVFAIKHVRYRKVPLYNCFDVLLLMMAIESEYTHALIKHKIATLYFCATSYPFRIMPTNNKVIICRNTLRLELLDKGLNL